MGKEEDEVKMPSSNTAPAITFGLSIVIIVLELLEVGCIMPLLIVHLSQ